MILFDGLSKHYDAFVAVNKLSFLVQQGEVFGFLGPNGAGKTTTIRMLMGILVPTAGHARIAALDCQLDRIEVKRRVGYLPDAPIFYDFLRGREILEFVGQMHGQSRSAAVGNAARLLDELALAEAAEEYAINYSTGFIWMHEVTHIWRGHCDWARIRLGLHELSEHVGPDGLLTDEYCAALRAFEHHADLQAFNHVLTEAQRGSISAFWVTSPELRLSLTIFAVCVLGVFWHGQQKLRGCSRAHPTPMERALSFLNYSHTWHELTDKVPDMFGAKVTMDQRTWRLAEQVAHVNLAKLTALDQFSSIVDVFSADVRQKLIVERTQLFAQLDDIVEEAMEVGPIL